MASRSFGGVSLRVWSLVITHAPGNIPQILTASIPTLAGGPAGNLNAKADKHI